MNDEMYLNNRRASIQFNFRKNTREFRCLPNNFFHGQEYKILGMGKYPKFSGLILTI